VNLYLKKCIILCTFMKNEIILLVIMLKINPALVMHKDGKENKKQVRLNYVYEFHYKSDVSVEPLKVARRT